VFAQQSNAGFVQGLWYSQEQIFADDPVRIYVAIRNNTGSDLTGTVEFFDGDKKIERKNVQALNGRIIESWADWTPTYGSHTLKANLSRTELSKVGSTTQTVEVTSTLAEDIVFVDHDTDKDEIGNAEDPDDDGDSISDAKEEKDGTDPLVKNAIADETSEENDDDEKKDTNDDVTDKKQTNTDGGTNKPRGLERYLAQSPAENVLSTVTNYINEVDENLDTYREKREEVKKAQASSTEPNVNRDGFGEVTRTTEDSKEGFFDKAFKLVAVLLSQIYTVLLTVLSFTLSHPMLVQLGILILILFLLMKFASKFGRRPTRN